MALNIMDARVIIKHATTTGIEPQEAPSNDHTDGSWDVDDIYRAEIFANTYDERLWIRMKDTIREIQLVGGSSNAFIDGGNSFGAAAVLGTNDNYQLAFETNNTTRMILDTNGNLAINRSSANGRVHIVADGAKTANYSGTIIENDATSSTAGVTKIALDIRSSGAWSGTSAVNIGLKVASMSGGTDAIDAVFNGGHTNSRVVIGADTGTTAAKLYVMSQSSADASTYAPVSTILYLENKAQRSHQRFIVKDNGCLYAGGDAYPSDNKNVININRIDGQRFMEMIDATRGTKVYEFSDNNDGNAVFRINGTGGTVSMFVHAGSSHSYHNNAANYPFVFGSSVYAGTICSLVAIDNGGGICMEFNNTNGNRLGRFIPTGTSSRFGEFFLYDGTIFSSEVKKVNISAYNDCYLNPSNGKVGIMTSSPVQELDVNGNIQLKSVGNKLLIKEGTNASMGTATLLAGTVTVNNTLVTANSRIFLTNNNNSGAVGELYISARSAGTSFTITSSSVLDTSTIAWLIIEPGA